MYPRPCELIGRIFKHSVHEIDYGVITVVDQSSLLVECNVHLAATTAVTTLATAAAKTSASITAIVWVIVVSVSVITSAGVSSPGHYSQSSIAIPVVVVERSVYTLKNSGRNSADEEIREEHQCIL